MDLYAIRYEDKTVNYNKMFKIVNRTFLLGGYYLIVIAAIDFKCSLIALNPDIVLNELKKSSFKKQIDEIQLMGLYKIMLVTFKKFSRMDLIIVDLKRILKDNNVIGNERIVSDTTTSIKILNLPRKYLQALLDCILSNYGIIQEDAIAEYKIEENFKFFASPTIIDIKLFEDINFSQIPYFVLLPGFFIA